MYEGKSGLKVLARAVLDGNDFCILAGGAGQLIVKILQYEFLHYIKELKKKKIKAKILVSGSKLSFLEKLLGKTSVTIRRLKKTVTKATFVLFGDKVAIYSLAEKPIVIMIEDKNITHALQVYFDILWKVADR